MPQPLPPVTATLKADVSEFKQGMTTAKEEMTGATTHGAGIFKTLGSSIKGSLSGVKGDLGAAAGTMTELGETGGSVFSGLSGAAGAGLAGAGTAIVGFAMKGVAKFEEVALAAGKFKDVTGATAEEASKFLAIAPAFGTSGDQIQGSMSKLEKQLGKNQDAFAKYGLEVVKTKSGQVDSTATFMAAVDALNAIQDPTQRNAAATAMFGKSWAGMSEMITSGSSGIKKAMQDVAPDKVFSDASIAKARDLRDGFDQIKQASEGLFLTVGQSLAPVIATLAKEAAKLIKGAEPLVKMIGDNLVKGFKALEPVISLVVKAMPLLAKATELAMLPLTLTTKAVSALTDAFEGMLPLQSNATNDATIAAAVDKMHKDAIDAKTSSLVDMYTQANEAGRVVVGLNDKTVTNIATTKDAEAAAKDLADAHKAIKQAIDDRAAAETALYDKELSRVDSQYAYLQNVRDTKTSIDELTKKLKDHKLSEDDIATAVEGTRSKMADLAKQYAATKGDAVGSRQAIDDMVTSLQDQEKNLAPNSPLRAAIDGYITQLKQVPTNVDTQLSIKIAGVTLMTNAQGDIIGNVPGGHKALGGRVQQGVPYLVGDNPDGTPNATSEIFVPDGPGTIIGAGKGRGLAAPSVTNNFYGITDYHALAAEAASATGWALRAS